MSMENITIVDVAEMCLEKSILRHGQKVYDVAQKRYEAVIGILKREAL